MAKTTFSKLGVGPWEVIEVLGPDEGARSVCAHCGHRITWVAIIEDEATGEKFDVGMKCAARASDLDTEKIDKLARDAERRFLEAAKKDAEFHAWAEQQPHPKGWENRSLMNDLRYWNYKKQGPAKWRSAYLLFKGGSEDAQRLVDAQTKRDNTRAFKIARRTLSECLGERYGRIVEAEKALKELTEVDLDLIELFEETAEKNCETKSERRAFVKDRIEGYKAHLAEKYADSIADRTRRLDEARTAAIKAYETIVRLNPVVSYKNKPVDMPLSEMFYEDELKQIQEIIEGAA